MIREHHKLMIGEDRQIKLSDLEVQDLPLYGWIEVANESLIHDVFEHEFFILELKYFDVGLILMRGVDLNVTPH